MISYALRPFFIFRTLPNAISLNTSQSGCKKVRGLFLLEGLVVDIYCELEPNLRITKRFSPTNHQIHNTPNNVKT